MSVAAMFEQAFGDLPALIHAQALERPGRIALIQGERELSYADLDRLMDSVAIALQRDGVKPREAVAICANTSI